MTLAAKVVYAGPGLDFVTRTAPFEPDLRALRELPTDGVLFVVVTREPGNKAARITRLWPRGLRNLRAGKAWHGTDYYVLGVSNGQWFAKQYDEEDWDVTLRSFTGPETQTVRWEPPLPVGSVVFTGVQIPGLEWEQALELLEATY